MPTRNSDHAPCPMPHHRAHLLVVAALISSLAGCKPRECAAAKEPAAAIQQALAAGKLSDVPARAKALLTALGEVRGDLGVVTVRTEELVHAIDKANVASTDPTAGAKASTVLRRATEAWQTAYRNQFVSSCR